MPTSYIGKKITMRSPFVFLLSGWIFLSIPVMSKPYKGAEIRTNDSFLYGRFEVKMKSCQASGMLMSFFTFYDNPDFVTRWNEIDIEILGRYNNEVQYNAIVGKHEMHEHRQVLDVNPHLDFHVYAFDWTPSYIAWSVDGKELFRQTGEHIARMNQKQKIMMNIWPSEFWDWTGPWNESVLPLRAAYDFVRYYEYKPTTKDTFQLSWEDPFDQLDMSRWSFATHTFDGNACDFTPSNAIFKDGILYLLLTKGEFEEKVEIKSEAPPTDFNAVQLASAELIKPNTLKVQFTGKINKVNARKENFSVAGTQVVKCKFDISMTFVELELSNYTYKEGDTLIFNPPAKSLAKEKQEIPIQKK